MIWYNKNELIIIENVTKSRSGIKKRIKNDLGWPIWFEMNYNENKWNWLWWLFKAIWFVFNFSYAS